MVSYKCKGASLTLTWNDHFPVGGQSSTSVFKVEPLAYSEIFINTPVPLGGLTGIIWDTWGGNTTAS